MLLFAVLTPQAAPANSAVPEDDRKALLESLRTRFPDIAVDEYVRGAELFGGSRPSGHALSERRAAILARGKQLWERRFKDGRSLGGCFPNGGKRVAATYPQYDPRTRQVLTLEAAINRCLNLHHEEEFDLSAGEDMAAATAYLRSLADGRRMTIRINGAAAIEKYSAGKAFFFARRGQRNYACASCHLQHAGQILRDRPLAPAIGQAAQWPRLDAQGALHTLQSQYATCLKRMGVTAPPLGDEVLNNLEYFHSYLSNSLPLKSLP